ETRFGGGDPETVFLHADWRGCVVLATDAAGNAVGRYGYSAYGEPFAAGAANRYAPRFGFSSKERDASGLVYYDFRHASPELCRWITPDPIRESGGLNLYAFCGGNPICYVDEEGEIILQVVVVAFAAYTIYQLLQKFVNSAIGLGTAYHKIQLASQRLCVLRETEQYEEIKEVYSEIINNTGECAKIAAENLPVVSFALRSGGGIIKPQPHYDAPVLEQSLTGRFKYKKINGYLRKDGKYVPPHYRRFPRKKTPDGIPFEPEMPKPNNTLYPR
ncbi:MAG: RHS repeat-associated core domain-containing protein, partial [Kiritimatiellae bacterium]|nr:RHS repeat-associated core domain-containing protein [Kiritimatiellia bacterium]